MTFPFPKMLSSLMLIKVCEFVKYFPSISTSSPFYLGFVVPGFIDVHSHWGGYIVPFPAKSWEMQSFLAYGVTTMHKYVLNLSRLHLFFL